MFPIEELALTVMREREEEARRLRPRRERPGGRCESVRGRLARLLVAAGLHLDPSLGKAGRLSGRQA